MLRWFQWKHNPALVQGQCATSPTHQAFDPALMHQSLIVRFQLAGPHTRKKLLHGGSCRYEVYHHKYSSHSSYQHFHLKKHHIYIFRKAHQGVPRISSLNHFHLLIHFHKKTIISKYDIITTFFFYWKWIILRNFQVLFPPYSLLGSQNFGMISALMFKV